MCMMRLLGAHACGFTVASLRAGRATDLFREVRDVSALRFLGRWKNARSLEAYVQEAMAALVSIDLEDCEPLVLALRALEPTFEHPPKQHWSGLFSRKRQYAALLRERERLLSCVSAGLLSCKLAALSRKYRGGGRFLSYVSARRRDWRRCSRKPRA